VLRVALVAEPTAMTNPLALAAAGGSEPAPVAPPAPSAIPVALDIQVTAPRMPFIDTKNAQVDASADLQVRGTFDEPEITGTIDILGGQWVYAGNRYYIQQGSIDFPSGDRLNPVFDLAVEARPRLAGQTYVVTVRLSGTRDRLRFQLSSDPWMPESDVISLVLGATPDVGTAETRALGSSQEQQQRMIQTAGAAILTSPLTSFVGNVVERTGALDTVQITPVLTNENTFGQLNPSARITLGKRISPRVYLTYSRTLSGPQEELILLEYDESDRISWVLSRNEDRTFALDFRIRYVF
jgi:autotransporter translocation and assembly factor TamB